VQFYIKGATRPYEIVVFDVTKDKLNGYLSTPKDVAPRGRSSGSLVYVAPAFSRAL